MKTISLNTILKKEDNFIETEIDGERIVMHIDNAEFFVFNPTSQAIWSAIDGSNSISDICQALKEQFEIEGSAYEQDVLDFANDLGKKNLVTTV